MATETDGSSGIAADALAVLFSADWFLPYWRMTGFIPRPGCEQQLQHEMREIVTQMMGGSETYWHVDRNPARLARTREAVLGALEAFQSGDGDLSLIKAILSGGPTEAARVEVSMTHWFDYEATVAAIERADLTATNWDLYLAGLTPDLPDWAQTFMQMDVMRRAR